MAARGRGRGRGNQQTKMAEMWRAIESLTQAVEGLRQALQRQEPMGVPDGVRNREVGDLVEEEDLEDLEDNYPFHNTGIADQVARGGSEEEVKDEKPFHETGTTIEAIGGEFEMDWYVLEPVYDKYDDEEDDSDLFGEASDLFVCEGEQYDFVLDEGFLCEGKDSDLVDGGSMETIVSKQAICDFVWMDIGWLFDHDMNQKKKPK